MKRIAVHSLSKAAPLWMGVAVLLLWTTSAWACPGCKDALSANDGEQGNLVAAYFYSILFMMSMPFVLVGTFGGSMYLAVRRARAQQQAPASAAGEEESVNV